MRKKKNNLKPKAKRGRGRPRKKPQPLSSKIAWDLPKGVRFVIRSRNAPQALTHRWIAHKDNQVIGYYKTSGEAIQAFKAASQG